MSDLSIEPVPVAGTGVVLDLRGELVLEEAERLVDAMRLHGDRVVLDLDGVTFMDSSGLRALVVGTQRLAAEHIRVVLARPREQVRQLLRMTRTDVLFETYEDRESAIAALARAV